MHAGPSERDVNTYFFSTRTADALRPCTLWSLVLS
jgi:hypothetical protein